MFFVKSGGAWHVKIGWGEIGDDDGGVGGGWGIRPQTKDEKMTKKREADNLAKGR
jgi:hypothetical protein